MLGKVLATVKESLTTPVPTTAASSTFATNPVTRLTTEATAIRPLERASEPPALSPRPALTGEAGGRARICVANSSKGRTSGSRVGQCGPRWSLERKTVASSSAGCSAMRIPCQVRAFSGPSRGIVAMAIVAM